MQDVPRCFGCNNAVQHDPIYEAPCGHPEHASAVFHPLCLMEWRERREAAVASFNAYMKHLQEHAEGEHE